MQYEKRWKHAHKGLNLSNEMANDSKVKSGSAAPLSKTNSREYAMSQTVL